MKDGVTVIIKIVLANLPGWNSAFKIKLLGNYSREIFLMLLKK